MGRRSVSGSDVTDLSVLHAGWPANSALPRCSVLVAAVHSSIYCWTSYSTSLQRSLGACQAAQHYTQVSVASPNLTVRVPYIVLWHSHKGSCGRFWGRCCCAAMGAEAGLAMHHTTQLSLCLRISSLLQRLWRHNGLLLLRSSAFAASGACPLCAVDCCIVCCVAADTPAATKNVSRLRADSSCALLLALCRLAWSVCCSDLACWAMVSWRGTGQPL
jgi:hypothetical protein